MEGEGEGLNTGNTEKTAEQIAAEAASKASAQPAFNETEYLTKEFGIADKEAIKASLTEFPTIKQTLTDLQTRWTPEVEQEYNTLKTTPPVAPYKTEEAKYVDDLAAKGISLKTIAQYIDVDPEKMEDTQAIKLATKLQNKGWEDKHVEADFQSKFIVDDTDPSVTDTYKTLIDANRIKAAQESKAFLKEFIGKQFTAPVDTTANAQAQAVQKATDFWTAQSTSLVAPLSKVSGETELKLPGGKGEVATKVPYTFSVPENSLKEITANAVRLAAHNGIPNTEEGVKQVQNFIQQSIFAKHGHEITAIALQEQQNKFIDFITAEFHNGTPPKAGGGFTTPAADDDRWGATQVKKVVQGQPAN